MNILSHKAHRQSSMTLKQWSVVNAVPVSFKEESSHHLLLHSYLGPHLISITKIFPVSSLRIPRTSYLQINWFQTLNSNKSAYLKVNYVWTVEPIQKKKKQIFQNIDHVDHCIEEETILSINQMIPSSVFYLHRPLHS